MKEYKQFLKDHGITDMQVGSWFGYKNARSWYAAARREDVIKGVLKIAEASKGISGQKVSADELASSLLKQIHEHGAK